MSEVADQHWRTLFPPSDFVSAHELKGRDVALTIKSVSKEELAVAGSSKTETKAIIRFVETPKKLVLNKTNATTIARLLGVLTREWVGKRIALFPTTTRLGPDTVECIRVRPKLPPPKRANEPEIEPSHEEAP